MRMMSRGRDVTGLTTDLRSEPTEYVDPLRRSESPIKNYFVMIVSTFNHY